MHPIQNLKPNIVLGFMFAYGCINSEVVVVFSGFKYLEGYFRTSFKLSDDHMLRWVMSSEFSYLEWCPINGAGD